MGEQEERKRMNPSSSASPAVHHSPRVVVFSNANAEMDISEECSTNTEDYGSCTENSRRTSQGIKPETTTLSSSAPPTSQNIPGLR